MYQRWQGSVGLAMWVFGRRAVSTRSSGWPSDRELLGTRKKMMLCAAWIGAPRVLLLDEPSNGLDLASRDHLIRLLRHWGRDSAILFVAHDEGLVSACGAAVIEMWSLLESGQSAPA